MTFASLEFDGNVALLMFSNGAANYFSGELLNEVADLMEQAADRGARSLVLHSKGKHFCAGADFSSIGDRVVDRATLADAAYAAGMRIYRQRLPVVAAVQGAAIGGGLGLACAADFRVVTPSTRLEANFTKLGFHPGFGLSAALPRIVGGQQAQSLLMTSRRVSGADAMVLGLADYLADEDTLLPAATRFARAIADLAPLAVQAVKATVRKQLIAEVESVLQHEASEQRRLWASEDAAIGLAAAKARAVPQFVGR